MKHVSVMVVEDSPVARELITDALNSDPRLRVVCAVDTAEKALRLLAKLAPDVISMDIRLPGMDGIEATRRIMTERPTPVVVVAADHRNDTVSGSMEALRAGALAVVEKPRVESPEAYRAMASRLCDQFVNMSQVKVVRQRFVPEPAAPCAQSAALAQRPRVAVAGRAFDIVAIAASTGGPAAIASVLKGIGADFAAPILVVQHMAGTFLEGYAAWLGDVCRLPAQLARDGETPRPGAVHIAPSAHHLIVAEGKLRLSPDAGRGGHVPSADMLFRSLAADSGSRAIGVLLTGMGNDGAAGLLALRRAGARTIAQDRATSAVYGMPGAAVALGAASEQLPIGAIADRVRDLVGGVNRDAAGPSSQA
jgi:two-component system chemotaxis response regulator CheB